MESMSLGLLILKTAPLMEVLLLKCKKGSLYIRIQLLFLILGVAVALIILKDRKIFLMSVLSLDV